MTSHRLTSILRRLLPVLGAGLATLAGAADASGFVLHRGTNLSHWLSQDFGQAPRAQFITENDLAFIAHAGFDHVRLPIDEKELWQADGQPDEKAFGYLLQAIGWSRAHGLRVIVDLHTVKAHHFNAANEGLTNTLWTDPRAQEHFLGLWRELSARLHDQPVDAVAYEIMNEPVADNPADWNRIVAASLKQIRATEPSRVVVVGSNRWQSAGTMPQLEVPAGDRNLILSIHTYTPLLLTHHLAGWTPLKSYTGPVHYPGPIVSPEDFARLQADKDPGVVSMSGNGRENWGAALLRQELAPAIKRAHELGLPLYCGEFGCLPTVPRADRLAYYRDLVGVFESEGIAWANWEYKSEFGLYEWHGDKYQGGAPDIGLLDALFQRR